MYEAEIGSHFFVEVFLGFKIRLLNRTRLQFSSVEQSATKNVLFRNLHHLLGRTKKIIFKDHSVSTFLYQ